MSLRTRVTERGEVTLTSGRKTGGPSFVLLCPESLAVPRHLDHLPIDPDDKVVKPVEPDNLEPVLVD